MLLNSSCRSQAVPVEVSLTLASMASGKSAIEEASRKHVQPSSKAAPHSEATNLSKQRSTSSSRASLEASIDALVDAQLAKLAEVIVATSGTICSTMVLCGYCYRSEI